MTYYHCSPAAGIKLLEPQSPMLFSKPAGVYMATLLPMALMYGVQNYEYTYGYTPDRQICFEEYFPNELEVLYKGKSASLYICRPEAVKTTRIPNEAVSCRPVPVLEEIRIPDVYEALLEQERLGALCIRRYHQLSEKMLEWIRKTETEIILEKNMLSNPGTMADYYRTHYPDSWADAQKQQALK